MHKSIKFGITAGALFATGLFVSTTPVKATIITTSNQAVYATATISAGTFPSSLNSQYGWDQSDISVGGGSIWSALTWTSPQDLNRLNLEFTQGYMVNGFKAQYSTVANPSGSVDANWQDVTGGTFTGVGSGGQNFYSFNPGVTNATGVRVLATDASNVAGTMRIREIWAFSNYHNLALTATVTAPGWGGTLFNNERVAEQDYAAFATYPTNTFSWTTTKRIGGMLIVGGLGEYPADFSIQSWNGASWNTVTNITGNTLEGRNVDFANIVETDKLRLYYTAAGGPGADSLMRISEVFIFEAIPEPSTFLLFGFGGLLLWRKTRKA